jgi:hypothetical protein
VRAVSVAQFEAHIGDGVEALDLARRARRVLSGKRPAVADVRLLTGGSPRACGKRSGGASECGLHPPTREVAGCSAGHQQGALFRMPGYAEGTGVPVRGVAQGSQPMTPAG